MKERPILFSGPMVRAILEGRKTQTRRVMKPQPLAELHAILARYPEQRDCPRGERGDRLWVREALRLTDVLRYGADESRVLNIPSDCPTFQREHRPAMLMPRWASRITLEITDVRVERLQGISARDILAEGAVARAHDDQFGHNPVSAFDGKVYLDLKSLWAAGWDTINGKTVPWKSNPWVWVISFRRANFPAQQEAQSAIEHEEAKAK